MLDALCGAGSVKGCIWKIDAAESTSVFMCDMGQEHLTPRIHLMCVAAVL